MGRHWGSVATRRARTTAYGVVAACLALAAPAAAQSTGGSPPVAGVPGIDAPPAPKIGPTPFGVAVRPVPQPESWRCMRDCASTASPRTGSVVRVRGRALARTSAVVFLGTDGPDDDVEAAPVRKRRNRVDVRVPLGAVSGPLLVADRDGQESLPTGFVTIAAAAASTGSAPAVEVQVHSRRAFYDAARPAKVSYIVHWDSPAYVLVELVRESDAAVIASWEEAAVQPEVPKSLTWDGTVAGKVQHAGRYSFRVSATTSAGVRAVSAQAEPPPDETDPAAFRFLGHEFPIRGPHYYGEHAARFGGGRGHQGQDVFAACGTPLVAARGGIVKFKQFHGAAGHYIVIDGQRTGRDYSYMHMRDAALVDEGDRVRTGQVIGYVGDTGSASACHLHFELWSSPGWYDGGSALDPLQSLRSWDKLS
jgi:murein DD-endopeptidase MepM/ murein hydrolase activator NlpD